MVQSESIPAIVAFFNKAERFVRSNGFAWEIDACDRRPSFHTFTDQQFLREYAWVVFNSGMKNRIVMQRWDALSKAFRFFDVHRIQCAHPAVLKEALNIFGNYAKVNAVLEVAREVEAKWLYIKERILQDPLPVLDGFPFIGPVTKFHLARNLGFDYIKPDRHLVRLGLKFNMTAVEFCEAIHQETGRRLGTVDVILWRYCEQNGQLRLL